AASGRTTGCQSLHIIGETLDVVWCMFHVIADIVRVSLSVSLPLLETTVGAGMRAGVINRLPLRKQFDCSIDALCLRCLGLRDGRHKRYEEHTNREAPDRPFHGFPQFS